MIPKVPSNSLIVKYTSGGEYALIESQKEYQGYYYEFGNRKYAGKEWDIDNPEIIEISKISLEYNAFPAIKIINDNRNNGSPGNYVFDYSNPSSYSSGFRYFCVKVNNPTLIREINEADFKKFTNNPLYKTVALAFGEQFSPSDINQAEKIIPGIRYFLSGTSPLNIDYYPEDLTGGYTDKFESFSL